jgi:hypothetical protein
MPRNGSGTYVLPAGNPVVPGTVIQTAWANPTMSDIAAALTASISADGQTSPVANLPMGGFKHTGAAPAAAVDEYALAGQVQHQAFNVIQGAAMAVVNVYTGTLPLGLTTFTNGMFVIFVVPTPGSNTGPATLSINGGAANNITDGNGGPLGAGALGPGAIALLGWDGTNWRSVLGGAGSALGYVPVNKAGDTMTGALTVPTPLTVTSATSALGAYVYAKATWVPASGNALGGFQTFGTDGGVNTNVPVGYMTMRAAAAWSAGNMPTNILFHVTQSGGFTQVQALAINADQTTLSGRGLRANLFTLAPAAGAAITVDFTGTGAVGGSTGQCMQITLAGNLTMTNVLIPQGAMMRIVFQATNLGTVTWPGYVIWPLGVAPNLAAGAQKYAIVTLVNAGAWVLGNASAY